MSFAAASAIFPLSLQGTLHDSLCFLNLFALFFFLSCLSTFLHTFAVAALVLPVCIPSHHGGRGQGQQSSNLCGQRGRRPASTGWDGSNGCAGEAKVEGNLSWQNGHAYTWAKPSVAGKRSIALSQNLHMAWLHADNSQSREISGFSPCSGSGAHSSVPGRFYWRMRRDSSSRLPLLLSRDAAISSSSASTVAQETCSGATSWSSSASL